MKRSSFIALFIGTQVLFVVLQIHKHTYITQLSYKKQKLDGEKYALERQKQLLTNKFYSITDRSTVKKFAEEELRLKALSLSQVKKLTHDK